MSSKTLNLDARLYRYLVGTSLREPKVLAELRDETSRHKYANMQIAPEQGQFMGLIARLIDARSYLELGTFTGYSSTVMALNMGHKANIVCCDISKEFTDIAKRYWRRAGICDHITLHLGPAAETLEHLMQQGASGTFDIVFIDADKENYLSYYEFGLKLVRDGGLIAIDNVLWGGAVADPKASDKVTVAIRQFNTYLSSDKRINLSVIPIGDGLTLAQKK